MPHYRVVIDAELVTKAKTRDIIVNRVRRMLREAGFEWSVEAIKPKEVEAMEAALKRNEVSHDV